MIKFILLGVVVFAVFFIAMGRSTMEKGRRKYTIGFDLLADKAHHDLPDCAHEDLITEKFMSDSGRCYLLVKDKVSNVLALVSQDKTIRMKYSSERSCEIKVSELGKSRFSGIVCRIDSPDLGEPCDIILGENPHFFGSFIGKTVLSNAEMFKTSFENQ